MNTLDSFVKKMPPKKSTKKTDEIGPENTPEQTCDNGTMSEVNKTLILIQQDIKEVKMELQKTIKDDKLESLVSSIVKRIVEQNNKKIETKIKDEINKRCEELEKCYNTKIVKMENNIENLEKDVETLREKLASTNKELRESKQVLHKTEIVSREAMKLSNQNEQYSRKYNFKIVGVTENDEENTWKLVKKFLKEKANVELDDQEIIAAHRIPGRKDQPRPIIVKVLNTNIKARVMKKRSDVKKLGHGMKLVDDVTRPNTELITALLKHPEITSAWYFNGSVYGKLSNERRVKFDIFDDIDAKVQSNLKGR